MTNHALSSTAQMRVGLFAALMMLAIALIAGILPALVLLWGWFMLRRNRDFAYVETSVTVVKGLLYLAIAGCVIAMLMNVYWYATVDPIFFGNGYRREHVEWGLLSLLAAGVPVAYLLALHFLYLAPLRAHREWVEQHGVLATKPRALSNHKADTAKGAEHDATSVADELLKWVALKENGHISDEEFNEARRKLLLKA